MSHYSRSPLRIAARVAWIAALGCSSVNDPSRAANKLRDANDVAFQTDSASYTLRASSVGYEGKIGYEFTNRTSTAAYFVNCHGGTSLHLEKRVNGRWINAWAPVLLACLSPPITVQRGATHRSVIHVFGGFPANNAYPKFSVPEIAGTYRIVWTAVLRTYNDKSYPFGDPLPLAQRVSNEFVLRTAQ